MNSEQIRAVVEAALRDGIGFPWLAYVLAIALSMGGTYFVAYSKRKGEDRANQDGFAILREQLRRTTEDTEQIKAQLSSKQWLSHQQWTIREARYAELLSHLTKLRLSLGDRNSYFMEPGSEHNSSLSNGAHFTELSRKGHDSYQAIRELIGPAAIFLSRPTIDALEKLVRGYWNVAEFSACTAEYVSEALELVEVAYEAVLSEARNELAHSQSIT